MDDRGEPWQWGEMAATEGDPDGMLDRTVWIGCSPGCIAALVFALLLVAAAMASGWA
jgi:hypothetical protein